MKDGLQNISQDRILIRVINYMQIVGWVVGFIWGSIQIVRYLDRMNQNITTLQQQQAVILQELMSRK